MNDQINPTTTPVTRAPQSAANTQLNIVKSMLEQAKGAIASRIPKHLTPDRIIKVALTAINKTPKLLECTKESLLGAIMQAAELGLEPGGALGEGYLVPYKVKGVMVATFVPGYRGLISLARRSGQIVSIEARVVNQRDAFSCCLGLDPDLKHTPAWEEADPGPLRLVYAVAKLKDGGVQFEIMSLAQIQAVRAKSQAGNYGPWVDNFEEMAKKTVIRRLFKYLPVSVEMVRAEEINNAEDSGNFESLTIDSEAISVESVGMAPEPPSLAVAQATAEQSRPSRADALKANLNG
jgi:recombination protein RecT